MRGLDKHSLIAYALLGYCLGVPAIYTLLHPNNLGG